MRARVVILAGQSLFAAGLASRLQEYAEQVEVHSLPPSEPDPLARMAALAPHVVLLDTSDPHIRRTCPLASILKAVPRATVIHLDPESAGVQIVTSRSHTPGGVDDLVKMILARLSPQEESEN